jgi:hypothetical protein
MRPIDGVAASQKILCKKSLLAVDDRRVRAIFAIPPEAGFRGQKTDEVGSRNFWDCKLNSILSRHDERKRRRRQD